MFTALSNWIKEYPKAQVRPRRNPKKDGGRVSATAFPICGLGADAVERLDIGHEAKVVLLGHYLLIRLFNERNTPCAGHCFVPRT